ncbi:hypothetical protein PCASD_12006, partial [Puccinia coronata f. sp. avenae]
NLENRKKACNYSPNTRYPSFQNHPGGPGVVRPHPESRTLGGPPRWATRVVPYGVQPYSAPALLRPTIRLFVQGAPPACCP